VSRGATRDPRTRCGIRDRLLELDRVDDLLDLLRGFGTGALERHAIDPDEFSIHVDPPLTASVLPPTRITRYGWTEPRELSILVGEYGFTALPPAPGVGHPCGVPLFMDRHEFVGLTAEEAAVAHLKDLEVQSQFGVRFVTYWFDDERQTAFCLATGPNRDAVEAVHRASHGIMPYQIIEVDGGTVARFMGGITEHPSGEPYVDTAFRTILFTDIEGSTSFTQTLGDARAMALLRTHDEIVREALERHGGSEVKHTGDGVMASFPSVAGGIRCAVRIQDRLHEANERLEAPLRVRIGLAAGEPVTERDDLFGAAVQLAARLCAKAEPGTILASGAVHDLAVGKGFAFRKRGRLRLKGFDEAVAVFEVEWSAPVPV
jgi:class 3 adenylate cyclase